MVHMGSGVCPQTRPQGVLVLSGSANPEDLPCLRGFLLVRGIRGEDEGDEQRVARESNPFARRTRGIPNAW
jgi:hypothetical protein